MDTKKEKGEGEEQELTTNLMRQMPRVFAGMNVQSREGDMKSIQDAGSNW